MSPNLRRWLWKRNKLNADEAALAAELREALKRQQFVLHYQPVLEVSTLAIHHFEALVRWQHPELGLVPSQQFVRLAERSELIVPIGEWALRTACATAHTWSDDHLPKHPIAVNLSRPQLQHPKLVSRVAAILAETAFDPAYLILEIAERDTKADLADTAAVLQQLRGLGVSITLDDFTDAPTAADLLRRLGVQAVKIDIPYALSGQTTRAAAASAVDLAHALDLHVTGKRVEDYEQLQLFRTLDCDYMQGYAFGMPLSAVKARSLLTEAAHGRGNPQRQNRRRSA